MEQLSLFSWAFLSLSSLARVLTGKTNYSDSSWVLRRLRPSLPLHSSNDGSAQGQPRFRRGEITPLVVRVAGVHRQGEQGLAAAVLKTADDDTLSGGHHTYKESRDEGR